MDNDRIVESIRSGDDSVIEEVDRLLRGRLISIAINNYGLSRDDAEDVAQEVIARIWLRGREMREGSNLLAWSFTVLKNLAIDIKRRRSHIYTRKYFEYSDIILLKADDDPMVDPESASSRMEDIRDSTALAGKLLEMIGERHRETLIDCYLIDAPEERYPNGKAIISRVARRVGISRTALKSRVHRAIVRARAVIKEMDGGRS